VWTVAAGMAEDFHILQFKPSIIETPLKSIKFINDTDTVLLNPNIVDSSFGDTPFSASVENNIDYRNKFTSKIQLAGARKRLFFDPEKTQVGLVTCGGVCPGLNNVIRSLVNVLYYRYKVRKIYGFRYGFQGLIEEKSIAIDLTPELVKDVR
jgi:6-phosphofructokinase 1